jgi:hypothetical protein
MDLNMKKLFIFFKVLSASLGISIFTISFISIITFIKNGEFKSFSIVINEVVSKISQLIYSQFLVYIFYSI